MTRRSIAKAGSVIRSPDRPSGTRQISTTSSARPRGCASFRRVPPWPRPRPRTPTRARGTSSGTRSARRTDGRTREVATSRSRTPIATGTRGPRRCSVHATPTAGRTRACCSSATHASRSRKRPRTSDCGTGRPRRSPKPATSCCTPPSAATTSRGPSTQPTSSRPLPRPRPRTGSSIPGTSSWIATVSGSSVTRAPRASHSTSATAIRATTRSWSGTPPLPSAFTGVTPRVPTMIQVADYTLRAGPVPNAEKPVPAPGSKYTFFDTIRAGRGGCHAGRAARDDAPRLDALRGSQSLRPVDRPRGLRRDGRHVLHAGVAGSIRRTVEYCSFAQGQRQSKAKAKSALRRLTASGTDRFDRSADVHSIGSGFFDAAKAKKAGKPEAGNVPITIGGLPIRNLLSFEYESRYSLNGGALHCDDMRARCPETR